MPPSRALPDNPARGWERLLALMQFTPPYNVTGQPGISLPLYWNAGGLPIGTQLVATLGREDLLIQVATRTGPAVEGSTSSRACVAQPALGAVVDSA